jgi:hypothetical protein
MPSIQNSDYLMPPINSRIADPAISSYHQTDNAMTFKMSGFNDIVMPGQYIDIQFISRSFPKNVSELVSDFDWTVCQFVSDGVTMWASPEAVRDLELRQLQLITDTTRPITLKRIVKYLSYGFDANDDIMMKMMEFLTTGKGDGVEDDYN